MKKDKDILPWVVLVIMAFLITSNWYLKRVFGDTAGCPTTEIVKEE